MVALVLVLLSLAHPGGAPPSQVVAHIPTPPSPVTGTDGRTHLVYEVLLRNLGRSPVGVTRVAVHGLSTVDGAEVDRLLFHRANGTFGRVLPPGDTGTLLLDVTLPPGTRTPAVLKHRIDAGARLTVRSTVDRRAPVRVGPPLGGGNLAVFGCCGPPFGHRRAAYDGFVAQRYAVDLVRMDGALNMFAGDPTVNANYFSYGDPVSAVAPGRVLAVRDGVAESVPPRLPNVPDEQALGNMVIQDLGGGRTATYAHLRPGSITVRPGDLLVPGRTLGEVGNSGRSFQPHLHFQVTARPGLPSGLAAEGVPFVFERLQLDGRITGIDGPPAGWVREPASPPAVRTGEYPLNGDVLAFPER
ncbi:peptidase M23 [Virgisporangium aliadipatigenens]|uniref:Peptidase M23 n=2 Tax=Virgisporangium aliadipatigenens TaxID=741659 RepID=A0A8J3YLT6_9ACTN|nr:peptidase M23 [Virgisporangium aliadipatigenens]